MSIAGDDVSRNTESKTHYCTKKLLFGMVLTLALFCLILCGAIVAITQMKNSRECKLFEILLIADNDGPKLVDDSFKFNSTFTEAHIRLCGQFNSSISSYSIESSDFSSRVIYSENIQTSAAVTKYMQISGLTRFGDSLVTCDDKTGHVLAIEGNQVSLVADIKKEKGFKCEWLTVKDNILIAGSNGKPWTNNNNVATIWDNLDIFNITKPGDVSISTATNWSDKYEGLKQALKVGEGYIVHEAIEWVPEAKVWLVLPRKIVRQPYTNENYDEGCSSTLIICNETFHPIQIIHLGETITGEGFSGVSYTVHKSPSGEQEFSVWAVKTNELKEQLESKLILINCLHLDRPGEADCQIKYKIELDKGQKYEGISSKII